MRTVRVMRTLIVACLCASGSVHAAVHGAEDGERLTIVPRAIVGPDGSLMSGMAVVVHGERIEAVVAADQVEDGPGIMRFPDAVLSPGLVDIGSTLGVHGANRDGYAPIDPGVRVIDALNRFDPLFYRAAQAGITLVMIAPAADALISGSAAVLRTFVPEADGGGGPEVLIADGALAMTLGPSALSFQRAPSSRSGAMAMLREAFDDARHGRGAEEIREALAGERSVLLRAIEGEDVSAGLRLFDGTRARLLVQHARDIGAVLEDFDGLEAVIVLGPLNPGDHHRVLSAPLAAANMSDITLVLRGATPARGLDGLRMTASIAVRLGLPADRARRAITSDAALAAGVRDRTGAIEPGLDADLVLFTADPLRADARVAAVYVRGRRLVMPHESHEAMHAVHEVSP